MGGEGWVFRPGGQSTRRVGPRRAAPRRPPRSPLSLSPPAFFLLSLYASPPRGWRSGARPARPTGRPSGAENLRAAMRTDCGARLRCFVPVRGAGCTRPVAVGRGGEEAVGCVQGEGGRGRSRAVAGALERCLPALANSGLRESECSNRDDEQHESFRAATPNAGHSRARLPFLFIYFCAFPSRNPPPFVFSWRGLGGHHRGPAAPPPQDAPAPPAPSPLLPPNRDCGRNDAAD